MPDPAATMIRNLEEKSGKTMAQWSAIVKKMGSRKHGEIVTALKADYGLGHGYANLVAHHAAGNVKPAGDDRQELIEAMYAGPKAELRPIYDRLIAEVKKFGPGVEIAPKKTYVSLRRAKQFGLIQPTTKTRIDVGLNLKGTPPAGRLEKSGSFNAMVSHRVRLESAKGVDKELIGWLKSAYSAAE